MVGVTMTSQHRKLAVVEFEIDDQTPEDLSIGLERLREIPAVFNVLQTPAYGKKGRLLMHVHVLAAPSNLPEVIAACFRETTTIGLRHHTVNGVALKREMSEVEAENTTVRVKTVQRPGIGATAKAEAMDVAAITGGHARRGQVRETVERRAREARTRKASRSQRV